MGSDKFSAQLDRLAEGLVLAEPSDLTALAELHTQLEALVRDSGVSGVPGAAETAKASAGLVEKLILGESSDPAAALGVLGRAVSSLRALLCDGRSFEDSQVPAELAVEPASDGPVPGADAAIIAEFLGRQPTVLEEFEGYVLAFDKSGAGEPLAAIKRILHNLKGEAALLGFADVEHFCHGAEDLLNNGGEGRNGDFLFGVKDWLSRAFAFRGGKGGAPEEPDVFLSRAKTAARKPEKKPEPKPAPEPAAEEVLVPVPPGLDMSLCGDFISESREHLEAADVHLLTLETDPENADALAAVFRAFHTIKGVAGFLGMGEIGKLAHEAENLLDKARKHELTLTGPAIDVAFEATDALKRLVNTLAEALGQGAMPGADKTLPALLARIRSAAAGQAEPTSVSPPLPARPGQKLGDILIESGAATRESVESAARKQQEATGKKKLGDILVESVLVPRRDVDAALAEQAKDPNHPKLGEVLVRDGAASPAEIGEALARQAEPQAGPKLGEILVKEGDASARDVAAALRAQKAAAPANGQTVQVKETVKIDAERLDRLLDMIGELVIAESMVSQSSDLRSVASPQLERHLSQLDKITRELQEMGTSLRMVPVKATFQKMARLVRDVARKANKQVEFITTGDETELDKSVVDLIGDPLVHMVRNAVDHGIEPADERKRLGKPETGRVELRAYHKGGNIHIEMADDGRGLQKEAILAKAREKGLIRADETPSDHDIYNMIFLPGFSTAKVVTDVSGRGVGMDVVKKNIEALRGAVDIQSEAGKGTVFTIRLPLTLAIIDGMVVRLGSERYIIPTLSVVRSVRPTREEMFSVLGKGEMLKLQGQLIPLFRLDRLFESGGAEQDATRAVAVIIEDEGRQAAILTDELLGQQQIVIKSLGEGMKNVPGVSGGAIMPDGVVGLILDPGGLVALAGGTVAEDGK